MGDRFDVNLFCGSFMHAANEGVTMQAKTMLAPGRSPRIALSRRSRIVSSAA